MYRSVYELTSEEISELKANLFWQGGFYYINDLGIPILFPGDIPDHVIVEHYHGVLFVEEDFFCNLMED